MSAQLPPAWVVGGDLAYWLRHRQSGRCVLSRLIYSARTAVAVALIAASLAAAIASPLALIAGSFGGWVDQATSRLIDVWMAFPRCCCRRAGGVIGAGLTSVIAAIVVVDWTRFAAWSGRNHGATAARLRRCRARHWTETQRNPAAGDLPNLIPLG